MDIVPAHLCDLDRELYEHMWTDALTYDDEIFDNSVTTAVFTFGPTIVAAPTEVPGEQAPVPLASSPTNP